MKIYNEPKTEIMTVKTEFMMQGAIVSVNQGGGGGVAHAPARGEVID